MAESNLMPVARPPFQPISAKPADSGWAVEKAGPLPQAKGKGRLIDAALFAAVCGLGMAPERIRLDPKRFKTGYIKRIIASEATANPSSPRLVSFRAADGFVILHRSAGDAATPAPGAAVVTQPIAKISHQIDQTKLMAALDRQCPKPGNTLPIIELPFDTMNSAEARQIAADMIRMSGRYTVRAEFVAGHSGRTLLATRVE